VQTIAGEFVVARGDTFTFGRSDLCTFQVDEDDRNISRVAGSISSDGSGWVLRNESTSRSLFLTDELYGIRHELPPSRAHLITEARLRITLVGTARAHFELSLVTDALPEVDTVRDVGPRGGSTLEAPRLTDAQRMDLASLLWEYHDLPSRREPRPLSYEQASRLRGCTAKALERRLFELRRKLRHDGYPMIEDNQQLARFMMAVGAVRPADFEHLRMLGPESGLAPES
jgi:hypothetical protein